MSKSCLAQTRSHLEKSKVKLNLSREVSLFKIFSSIIYVLCDIQERISFEASEIWDSRKTNTNWNNIFFLLIWEKWILQRGYESLLSFSIFPLVSSSFLLFLFMLFVFNLLLMWLMGMVIGCASSFFMLNAKSGWLYFLTVKPHILCDLEVVFR